MNTYLDFVCERHYIWEQRQAGLPQPWTEDPILRGQKFTNVFRVLDPGSQFVFKLQDEDPLGTLMRLFLYRHTGRVEAWDFVVRALWPSMGDVESIGNALMRYRESGEKIFTSAYLVYPQSAERGTDKLASIIDLTQRLIDNGSFTDFLMADSQVERFACLRRNKGVADFMSMQILTDWGYTKHADGDREDEFVIPGPGAVRGAALLDPTQPAQAVLRSCWQALRLEASCPELPVLVEPDGAVVLNRLPSLMDVQNTLCEYSKYARYRAKGATTVRDYRPAHPGVQDAPILPAHWH